MEIKKTLLFCLLFIAPLVFSHGGRTDKYGCHNDRKNGGYHCHNGGSVANSQNSRAVNNLANSNSIKSQPITVKSSSSTTQEAENTAYKTLVFETQVALKKLSYDSGISDGILGKKTIKAIQHFQVDNELAVNGQPSYALLKILLDKAR